MKKVQSLRTIKLIKAKQGGKEARRLRFKARRLRFREVLENSYQFYEKGSFLEKRISKAVRKANITTWGANLSIKGHTKGIALKSSLK